MIRHAAALRAIAREMYRHPCVPQQRAGPEWQTRELQSLTAIGRQIG